MSWLLDHVPWWLYLVAGSGGVSTLLWLYGPVLIPLWAALPVWLRAVLIGLTGGFILYVMGRNRGAQNAREQQQRDNAQAASRRKDIDHEVHNLDRPAADKRLDRWMRDKKQ